MYFHLYDERGVLCAQLYMKRRRRHLFFIPLAIFFLIPAVGLAHSDEGTTPADVAADTSGVNLQSAGITPLSPFYFLDRLGEALQEFFTFNPEARARLHVRFASERVAEIQVIFEKKGVEARGLEIAQTRLQRNLARAATIVTAQKAEGVDVSELVQELDDEFEPARTALAQTFQEEKRELKEQEKELKSRLRTERRAIGDDMDELEQELEALDAELEFLDIKEREIEDDIEEAEDRREDALELKAAAQKNIEKAKRKKEQLLKEAREEGVELPRGAFAEFDRLIASAEAAFDAENFEEAKQLAKEAKKSLEDVDDVIDELEDVREAKEEAEEEAREREEEMREREEEARKEAEEVLRDEEGREQKLLEKERERLNDEDEEARRDRDEDARRK